MTLEHTFTNAVAGMSSRIYRLEDERRLVVIRDDDAQQDLDVSKTFPADAKFDEIRRYARACICLDEHVAGFNDSGAFIGFD